MQPDRPIVSNHRLARFIAWIGAVLAWCALGKPAHSRAQQRHHKRYGALSAAALARYVRNAILLRAIQLLEPGLQRGRRPTTRPQHIAPGVRLGAVQRLTLRRFAGAWLRRKLRVRGSFAAKVAHLLLALRHYRGLAAYVAWRRRFFTRRCAIVPTRPVGARIPALVAHVPCAADSS